MSLRMIQELEKLKGALRRAPVDCSTSHISKEIEELKEKIQAWQDACEHAPHVSRAWQNWTSPTGTTSYLIGDRIRGCRKCLKLIEITRNGVRIYPKTEEDLT